MSYDLYSSKELFYNDDYAHYLSATGHRQSFVIALMTLVSQMLQGSALDPQIDHHPWAQTVQGHSRTCCLLFA